jgi:hypothetical protein
LEWQGWAKSDDEEEEEKVLCIVILPGTANNKYLYVSIVYQNAKCPLKISRKIIGENLCIKQE